MPSRVSRFPLASGGKGGPTPARAAWSATTIWPQGTRSSAEAAPWRSWTSTSPGPPGQRGTWRTSPGSSCRWPTRRAAHAKGSLRRPTVPAGYASCAMATGSPSESGSGCPNSWSSAWKRALRGSRHWPRRACRPTADGPWRAYPPSYAPTGIGSSGTARSYGTLVYAAMIRLMTRRLVRV
jgi:hypothetical protein